MRNVELGETGKIRPKIRPTGHDKGFGSFSLHGSPGGGGLDSQLTHSSTRPPPRPPEMDSFGEFKTEE